MDDKVQGWEVEFALMGFLAWPFSVPGSWRSIECCECSGLTGQPEKGRKGLEGAQRLP